MSSWTDERVDLLKKLWGQGKTAAQIADVLGGVTRNAVIGKANRLKLSAKTSTGTAAPAKKTATPKAVTKSVKKAANTNIKKADKPAARIAPAQLPKDADVVRSTRPNGEGVALADLEYNECRWPVGDPREEGFHFCGAKKMPGIPYCRTHAEVAYQAATRKKLLNAADFEDKPADESKEASA